MTKSKVLRNYFKKFYDLDVVGMSPAQVLRDFMKKKYDYDSDANGFIGAIEDMIENDLAPGGSGGDGDTIIVDALPNVEDADPNKKYLRALCHGVIKNQGHSGLIPVSLTSNKLPDDAEMLVIPCIVVDSDGNAKMYKYDPSLGEIAEAPHSVTIATSWPYELSDADDPSATCVANMCGYYVFKANKESGYWDIVDIGDYGRS